MIPLYFSKLFTAKLAEGVAHSMCNYIKKPKPWFCDPGCCRQSLADIRGYLKDVIPCRLTRRAVPGSAGLRLSPRPSLDGSWTPGPSELHLDHELVSHGSLYSHQSSDDFGC